jgi:hypothetical protein
MKMASRQEKAFCYWVSEDKLCYNRATGVFFLSDYVKDSVFVQPLPTYIPDLKRKITEVVVSVTRNIILRFWEETE